MKTKVSVIMPVYCGGAAIAASVESALSQTLREIELIIIDDGSTDDTPDLLRAFAAKDSRVVIVSQQNRGAGAARNAGLDRALGEYVAFLDADDWYPDEDTLSLLYGAAKAHGAKIAGGSFCIAEDGKIQTKFDGTLSGYTFDREGEMPFSAYQFDYGYHRFLYDREMLTARGIRFPDYRRYQDPPFFVAAMIEAGRFYALREVTYCFRAGHKQIGWDEQKSVDLARGLFDVLKRAEAAGLDALCARTRSRIDGEFCGVFLRGLKAGFPKLFCELWRLNEAAGGEGDLIAPLREMLEGFSTGGTDIALREELQTAKDALSQIRRSASFRLAEGVLCAPRALKQRFVRGKFAPKERT